MSYELVVFDCDGVLVDSEILAIEIESELLTAAGFALSPIEVADNCVGLSYADMMAWLADRFGRPVPEGMSETIQRTVLESFPDRLEPVAGMGDVLAGLVAKRCVASSSDLDRVRLSLDVTDLARHFEPTSVFSAQMVQRGKPAPDLFLHAASTVGVDTASCVVVEDSPHGVAAGVAAGMTVVGFTAGLHAQPSLAGRLRDAGAAIVIDHADHLLEAIS